MYTFDRFNPVLVQKHRNFLNVSLRDLKELSDGAYTTWEVIQFH